MGLELDVDQIAKNLADRILELREQKEKLEAQLKQKLAAVNAELAALEKLSGIRKRPGRTKGVKTNEPKKENPLIGIAKAVLEAHSGEAFTSGQITGMAISTGLWENSPKSAKANMGRILSGIDTEATGIHRTDDKRYFIPSEDFE